MRNNDKVERSRHQSASSSARRVESARLRKSNKLHDAGWKHKTKGGVADRQSRRHHSVGGARYVIKLTLVHDWFSEARRDRCGYSAASLILSLCCVCELYCIVRMHGVSINFGLWRVSKPTFKGSF